MERRGLGRQSNLKTQPTPRLLPPHERPILIYDPYLRPQLSNALRRIRGKKLIPDSFFEKNRQNTLKKGNRILVR